MVRYLLRTMAFILPILGIIVMVECGLRAIPNNYSYTHERLLNHGDSIRILVLGNSHAFNGVDPLGFGVPAYNAANMSQDHRRDLAILEHYLAELPALRTIVLPLSYYSIGAVIEEGPEPWRVKNYAIYMDMPEQASSLEHRFEVLNARKSVSLRMLMDHLLYGSDNIRCRVNGGAPGRPKPGLDFVAHGKETAARHTFGPSGHYRINHAYLDRIIQLAAARGIQVHFFFPPCHKAYLDVMDPVQLALARKTGHELARTFQNVSYHDLSEDQRFIEIDFGNSDHLQASGTAKLTRILAEDLAGMSKD
jgi:hypothetical protein